MKILITGFEPFGGESINPSWEAVKLLPETLDGHEVVRKMLPCVFVKAGDVLDGYIQEYKPDFVFCVGQAGGRANLTVEKVGINLMDGRIADNEGFQPVDEPIKADGETAYFSNLPVKAVVNAIREAGIPASVSYTAGTYVCNYILYTTMYLINKKYPNIKGGFMHIPFAPEQAVTKSPSTPTMPIPMIAEGIKAAAKYILTNSEELKVNEGTEH
ncbi:MAG: pyroglutamyl-peptidase I [Clostridia bacterium]|nr:pyroglutamyl-peptidase I [Clostridia bacterium]